MVWLECPVLSDDGVTEVAHFLQHGVHERGAELAGVVLAPLPLLVNQVLGGAPVEVEGGARVQELTATLHVPEHTHTCSNYF